MWRRPATLRIAVEGKSRADFKTQEDRIVVLAGWRGSDLSVDASQWCWPVSAKHGADGYAGLADAALRLVMGSGAVEALGR